MACARANTPTHTRQTKLKDGAVVEINGFMPGLKLKKVLSTISEDLLHEKRTFRSMRAHAAFVAQMVLRSRVQAGLEDEEAADTDAAMVDDLALDDEAAESDGEGEGEGRGAGAGSSVGKRRDEGDDGEDEGEVDSGDDEAEAEAAARMMLDAPRGGEAAGDGCARQPREGGARGAKVPREVKNLGLDSMYSERERDAEVQREKLVRGGGAIVGSRAKGKAAEGAEGSGGRATRGMLAGTWGLGRRAPTEIYLLIHNIESQVSAWPCFVMAVFCRQLAGPMPTLRCAASGPGFQTSSRAYVHRIALAQTVLEWIRCGDAAMGARNLLLLARSCARE